MYMYAFNQMTSQILADGDVKEWNNKRGKMTQGSGG